MSRVNCYNQTNLCVRCMLKYDIYMQCLNPLFVMCTKGCKLVHKAVSGEENSLKEYLERIYFRTLTYLSL